MDGGRDAGQADPNSELLDAEGLVAGDSVYAFSAAMGSGCFRTGCSRSGPVAAGATAGAGDGRGGGLVLQSLEGLSDREAMEPAALRHPLEGRDRPGARSRRVPPDDVDVLAQPAARPRSEKTRSPKRSSPDTRSSQGPGSHFDDAHIIAVVSV